MKILNCYIIDDEPMAVALLSDYVNKTPQLNLLGSSTSAITGLSDIQHLQVDICFVDIQMPELTGLQIMNLVGNKTFFIITSAYSQYALDGYEHNAIDYLLKPISYDRFLKSTQKAINIITLPPTVTQEHIFIKTDGKHIKVNLIDILFIESMKDYLAIQLANERLITLSTLTDFKSKLPQTVFIQTHKSFIVNTKKIETIERNRIYIHKYIVPIGDTYKNSVLSFLKL